MQTAETEGTKRQTRKTSKYPPLPPRDQAVATLRREGYYGDIAEDFLRATPGHPTVVGYLTLDLRCGDGLQGECLRPHLYRVENEKTFAALLRAFTEENMEAIRYLADYECILHAGPWHPSGIAYR